MLERQLVSDFVGRQGERGAMENRIQPATATQQLGILDTARICSAASPFAFLNDPAAGAQPVKAKMHSPRSALTVWGIRGKMNAIPG
jgi:hypothetical protein